MERMLVVVFDHEDKTHEALRALEELNEQSVIAIYADAIVAKDRGGATTVVKTRYADPQGRWVERPSAVCSACSVDPSV